MNRFAALIALFIISGSLASCHFHKLIKGKVAKIQTGVDTSHILQPAQPVVPYPDTVGIIATRAHDSLVLVQLLINELTPLWNHRLDYRTFSARARVRIDGPDGKFTFTTHFKVRKDSAIWIEADAMAGLYKVRILITPDSLYMINYAQKEVTRMPLSQAAKVLPSKVDFASLQNLVIGEPLRQGVITNAKSVAGFWSIEVQDSSYIQHITYNKPDSTLYDGELLTHDPFGPRAVYQYSAYDTTGHKKIATARLLEIHNGADIYTLDLNFTKAEFDEPLDFPFYIPTNYTEKE